MLPSMPSLIITDEHQTLNNADNCIDAEDQHNILEEPVPIKSDVIIECVKEEPPLDVELDPINACQSTIKNNEESNIAVTTTIGKQREKRELLSISDKKKAKRKKQYLANIAMLTSPNPSEEKTKRDMFVEAYFDKLKKTLEAEEFDKIISIFDSGNENEEEHAIELYKKLMPILCPKYQDLADEFLLFLTIEQANDVGKLIPFFIMNHMVKFLNHLESYFKDQPSQLRKIQRTILELNANVNVTLEDVKNTVLPLLRTNLLLHDAFLQIFLEESPPATLLSGAWETLDLYKELSAKDDEAVQETVITENEDPSCTCTCHKPEEQLPLKHHCIKCGLRFAQGKIYCQTGRGPKLVRIKFPYNTDIDQHSRLGILNKLDHDSEKDDKIKRSRTYKPRAKKVVVPKDNKGGDKKLSANDSVKFPANKTSPTRRCRTKSLSFSALSENAAIHRYTKISTGKIESTFSSHDGTCDKWTREEDKIILETFQQNFNQDVVKLIAQRLKNRTVQEIIVRFERLMTLLQEMEAP